MWYHLALLECAAAAPVGKRTAATIAKRTTNRRIDTRRGLYAKRRPMPTRAIARRFYDWGARIRTWDRGTKTRCLTAWLRPTEATPVYERSVKRKMRATIAKMMITAIATAFRIPIASGTHKTSSCELAKIQPT